LGWDLLAGGLLSGKQADGTAPFSAGRLRRAYDALDVIRGIAETHNVTVG